MIALPENEVHLWCVAVDKLSRNEVAYKKLLSPKEKARANRFKFARDRTVSILARGLLRILSARYLDQDPESINFKYGEYGKPDFDFPTPLKFNISHSGNMIAVAFAIASDIGVDIEMIKTDFDVVDIARHFFSPDEIQTLSALPDHQKVVGFFRCWTRKEAFIKAKGNGLSFPLTSFSVSLDVHQAELLRTQWKVTEREEWKLFSFEPAAGYLGALSVRGDIQNLQHMDW